jgi:hypothetical protein
MKSRSQKVKISNFFIQLLFFAVASVTFIVIQIFWELGFKKIKSSFAESKLAPYLEKKIQSFPNWLVLIIFGIPFILMEVIGVIAAGFFFSGNLYMGIFLYLIKVLLFVPINFILNVGKDQLMQIEWYKRRFLSIIAVLDWFKTSETYVRVHNFFENLSGYIIALKNLFSKSVYFIQKAFHGNDVFSEDTELLRKEIELKVLTDQDISKDELLSFFNKVNQDVKDSQN